MTKKIAVVGGGPSGMIAAAFASKNGNDVTLYEKNDILGKKMMITGNGRCNITNLCSVDELIENVVNNKFFLYSSFYSFTNKDIIQLLDKYGIQIKEEKDKKCFPKSDKSVDVVNALITCLKESGVKIKTKCYIKSIEKYNKKYLIDIQKNNEIQSFEFDKVIIATGGKSYPSTGSTGDGYLFAENLGHKIIDTTPSIIPIEIKEGWVKDLQGISLENVNLSFYVDNIKNDEEYGNILFTHYGISGPSVLNLSSRINKFIIKNQKNTLEIDLFPNMNIKELDDWFIKLLQKYPNKSIINIFKSVTNNKFMKRMLKKLDIDKNTKGNQLTKSQRKRIIEEVKSIRLTIEGLRSLKEAYITSGGIDTDEVNPSTMESKLQEGLYFCGEILDVDAYTGGFNLQIAYSTGYLAGTNC